MFRKKTYLIVVTLAAGLALAAWGWSARRLSSAEASLAVFNVENMTCGSCAAKIESALKGVAGIGTVQVSVTSGRSQVEFDQSRIDAETIAQKITAAGFPASIRETLTAADYRALKSEEGDLGRLYVARIGKRLLSREEFEATLQQWQAGLTQPLAPQALSQMRQQVWSDLLQRELLLGSAEDSNVVVQDGEVALAIEKIKNEHPNFEQMISQRFGGLAPFSRQVRNDLIIRKHLDENVAEAGSLGAQRQQQLQNWYRQLVDSTPVVIFDQELKAAGGSGSGCGGTCCG